MKRLLLAAFLLGTTIVHAQLYNYGTNTSGIPNTVATNASATNLSRVNGSIPQTGCPDGFNSAGFSNAITFAATRPAVEFSISPNTGYQLNITNFSVQARRNNKGPQLMRLAYSLDGGVSWINNGSDFTITVTTCAPGNLLAWDIPDFSATGTVIFRVYGYGATAGANGVSTLKNAVVGGSVVFADIDNDSYTSNVDCNDFNSSVNPGATEICNSIDDNCNGAIDEGLTSVYYADADADSYGDAFATAVVSCNPISGSVTNNLDCDDSDNNINPGATEICNAIDDDCNGVSDDGLTFNDYYSDADADGFGDASATAVNSCIAIPGSVTNNSDCDDANNGVYPGASEVCNGLDDDCNGSSDDGLTFLNYFTDADGDGFGDASAIAVNSCVAIPGSVTDNSDCDDASNSINPAASEVCNAIDDDCSGSADDGLTFLDYYTDADGDGFGDASAIAVNSCIPVAGAVTDNTDCADYSAAIFPGSVEFCNGVDDDCDGIQDNGITFTTYYADNDGDTYGNPSITISVCDGLPGGFSENGLDCDDFNPAINPDAAEICNAIDDNCDGNSDEGLTFLDYYVDADGDGFGDISGSAVNSCEPLTGYVIDNSDCDDTDNNINPGAAEICNGLDENCNGSSDEGLTFIDYYTDADSDGFGDASASAVSSCNPVAGSVTDNSDCDDSDNSINPSGIEVCNTVDDNCNGNVDEGVTSVFYLDADADGFGTNATTVDACSVPAGYSTNSSDCNDSNTGIYPNAPEICGNGIDEDCDGIADLVANIAAGGPTTFCFGGSLTFTCTTAGTGLSYQWLKAGVAVAGATNATYTVTTTGNYKVTVSKNGCSATSSAVSVTVNPLPIVNIQTPDGTNLCGKTFVRLRASAGVGYTYQWFKDGSAIAGATGNSYAATTTGVYYVITTLGGCPKTSANITVINACREFEQAFALEMLVAPNPSNGNFSIQLMAGDLSGTANIQIVSITGQVHYSSMVDVNNGYLTADINTENLSGTYYIVANLDGQTVVQPILILN